MVHFGDSIGLRSVGPLAALLAPHIQPDMARPPDSVPVTRALPAGLGACSKVRRSFDKLDTHVADLPTIVGSRLASRTMPRCYLYSWYRSLSVPN